MPDSSSRPRTWLALSTAVIAPLLLAILFLTVMDSTHRPLSVAESRDHPDAGSQRAALDKVIVLLHALAQLTFIAAGAWWTRRRPGVRVAFLLVAVPISGLVFLLSFFGLVAG